MLFRSNNSSGTIHIVGETSPCANNEVRLVWANQDLVAALQRAVATLLTSPNGQYRVEVADDGIVLQGPGVSIQLDAGDPASPSPRVTVVGSDIVVMADQTTHVKSGVATQIDSGVDTRMHSDGTIHMQATGKVTIQGTNVDIQ